MRLAQSSEPVVDYIAHSISILGVLPQCYLAFQFPTLMLSELGATQIHWTVTGLLGPAIGTVFFYACFDVTDKLFHYYIKQSIQHIRHAKKPLTKHCHLMSIFQANLH